MRRYMLYISMRSCPAMINTYALGENLARGLMRTFPNFLVLPSPFTSRPLATRLCSCLSTKTRSKTSVVLPSRMYAFDRVWKICRVVRFSVHPM